MRVIAGSAKRIQLKTIEGPDTRPTQDRIKETLFNMLQYDLYDTVFIDLFSGSGGIGIEALSRGASKGVFVENNPKAIQCIRDNLNTVKLMECAEVIQSDVLSALHRLEGSVVADFVFMDPPYNQLLEKQVLEYLSNSRIVNDETVIIIEASKETDVDYIEEIGYNIIKIKEYKTNKHIFVEKV